jgi:hypothetical protein
LTVRVHSASRGTASIVLAGVLEIEEGLDEALRLHEQAAALRLDFFGAQRPRHR